MKKKIIWCLILLVVIAIIVSLIIIQRKNKIVANEDYYKITYSASYNTAYILDNNANYEIVKDKTKLNTILNKIQSKEKEYDDIFNSSFFESKNLLVIEAGIDSEINKLDINNTKANIVIYKATPLTTMDEIFDFNIYLIPISKDVNDVNVEILPYPDRVY